MDALKPVSIAVFLGVAWLPTRALSGDQSMVSDGTSLSASIRQLQLSPEQGAWQNPYLPQASASYEAPLAAGDEVTSVAEATTPKSADEVLARIVAQYRRPMLDRGGWENPYLPSTASGNALASVPVGNGVTLVANAPGSVSQSADEGAASGEPEEAIQPRK
jgi:hypothetical protein